MIKTDDGHYYVFPFVRGDEALCHTIGPMLREDWLEELGLEVPTTIDEWHTVLTAFKEKKGASAPFTWGIYHGGPDPGKIHLPMHTEPARRIISDPIKRCTSEPSRMAISGI